MNIWSMLPWGTISTVVVKVSWEGFSNVCLHHIDVVKTLTTNENSVPVQFVDIWWLVSVALYAVNSFSLTSICKRDPGSKLFEEQHVSNVEPAKILILSVAFCPLTLIWRLGFSAGNVKNKHKSMKFDNKYTGDP